MKLPNNKDLRRILVAQLPADFADWLDFVAIISLFTYTWSVDPIYFAFFALTFSLPYLVIGPFAGAIVDKYDLKTIMLWSNLGRAASTFALAFAGTPELVLGLVFFRASVDSFFSPAKQSAIQALAKKSELMSTNSISMIINQASKLAGPAVGGALLLFFSSQLVFFANSLVSLCAGAILLGLPRNLRQTDESEEENKGENKGMLADIADGYKVVGKIRALWVTIGLGAFGFFSIFLHDTLIGPVTKLLGFDQSILGFSITAVGAGGVVGALSVGSIKRPVHPYVFIGMGMLVSAGFTILLGFAAYQMWVLPEWFFVAAFFTVGIFGAAIFVPMRTILQLETPADKMGRVTAVNEAVSTAAMMCAPFVGAILAKQFGLGVPFLVGGSLSIILGIVTLSIIPIVRISDNTKPEEEAELSKTG